MTAQRGSVHVGALATIALAALSVLPACSSEKSYAVVTVSLAEGELTEIAQFLAFVSTGDRSNILYFPQSPAGRYRISTRDSIDFSVSFDASVRGDLKIGVQPRTRGGVGLGYGELSKAIDPGHVMSYDVVVTLGAPAPIVGEVDAGADMRPPPSDAEVPHRGCEPTMPAPTCRATETCGLSCPDDGGSMGTCMAAGRGKDGDSCAATVDCEPGTMCFTTPPCMGKICRKFCKIDADCPDGACSRSITCDGFPASTHKYCVRPCDPRGDAASICKSNLRCLLLTGEVTSCECETGRSKGDGEECTTLNCAPGLVCVDRGASSPSVCRPVCKLTEGTTCPAGRACTEIGMYKTWGACL